MAATLWTECRVITVISSSSNHLELDAAKLTLILSKFLVSHGEIAAATPH